MTSNRLAAKARAYAKEHGVKYQQALEIFRNLPPEDVSVPVTSELMKALGINDLGTYDPLPRWRANEFTESLRIPIGTRFSGEGESYAETDTLYLDLAEVSRGGTGPHGCIQGRTGSGKSYLLSSFITALCANYSPDRVNLALLDFKGGVWSALAKDMPHTVFTASCVEDNSVVMEQFSQMVYAEIARREEFLFKHRAKSTIDYLRMRSESPELPPLPDLFIVADEYDEFMKSHREYLALFNMIAAKGRSLGVRLIVSSHVIDTGLLYGVVQHLTFGISLSTSSAACSRTVLDGDPSAMRLPLGKGHAMVRYVDPTLDGENRVKKFRGFESLENFDNKEGEIYSDHVIGRVAERLAKVAHAAPKWGAMLSEPVYLDDILDLPENSKNPSAIRIGLQNSKGFDADTTLLTVDVSRNTMINGRSGSGKTTVAATAIVSAAKTHPDVKVFVINAESNSPLAEIRRSPNVVMYADSSDEKSVQQIFGELHAVAELRASAKDIPFEEYLDVAAGDPYRRILVVLDGQLRYDVVNEAVELCSTSGISFMATSSVRDEVLGIRHSGTFDSAERVSLGVFRDGNPVQGYCSPGVGFGDGKPLIRVALPTFDRFDAGEGSRRTNYFPHNFDYREGLRKILAGIPSEVDTPRMSEYGAWYPSGDVTGLWIGNYLDGTPAEITPRTHFVVSGGAESGKTTTLRAFLRSLNGSKSADDVKVVVIDKSMTLLGEANLLRESGMLMNDGHLPVSSARSSGTFKEVLNVIQSRNPRSVAGITPKQLRERTWFSGPDIYIVVDDSSRESLYPLVDTLNTMAVDVGVYLVMSVGDSLKAGENGKVHRFIESTVPVASFVIGANSLKHAVAGRGTLQLKEQPKGRTVVGYLVPED